MKITTNVQENQKQYLTKRYGNEPGLYLSDDKNQVWIVSSNGSVAGFFSVATQKFHTITWNGSEFKDDEHVAYCKIHRAPSGFEMKISQ